MTQYVAHKNKFIKYYIWIVVGLILCLFLSKRFYQVKQNNLPIDASQVQYPYRTIDSLGHAGTMYAYILMHKREIYNQLSYTSREDYGIVIRKINPAKDDFKTYCKLVIMDIVNRNIPYKRLVNFESNIDINIYDDDEAYKLAEKTDSYFDTLNRKENNFFNDHLVATYFGNMDEHKEIHLLNFYPKTHNRFSSEEDFKPYIENYLPNYN